MTLEQQRALIDAGLKGVSIVQQCDVLEIHRSGFYYTPRPVCQEDLRILRLMDELHMEDPCRGTRRLVDELVKGRDDRPRQGAALDASHADQGGILRA